jgi:hypothetical protein
MLYLLVRHPESCASNFNVTCSLQSQRSQLQNPRDLNPRSLTEAVLMLQSAPSGHRNRRSFILERVPKCSEFCRLRITTLPHPHIPVCIISSNVGTVLRCISAACIHAAESPGCPCTWLRDNFKLCLTLQHQVSLIVSTVSKS